MNFLREGDVFTGPNGGQLVIGSVTGSTVTFSSMKAPGSSVTISPGARYTYDRIGTLQGDTTDPVYTSLPSNSFFNKDLSYYNERFIFVLIGEGSIHFTLTSRAGLSSGCTDFNLTEPSSMASDYYTYYKTRNTTTTVYAANSYIDGQGQVRKIVAPWSMCTDLLTGDVYVADRSNHCIIRISTNGTTRMIAGVAGTSGYSDGPVTVSSFNRPNGVAMDQDSGILYICDTSNHVIRAINVRTDSNFTVRTFAGLGGVSGNADGTVSASSRFNEPTGIVVGSNGKIYVSERGNRSVRVITTTDGTVTTLATGLQQNWDIKIALDSNENNVYVAGPGNITVINISTGRMYILAGHGGLGFKDGLGTDARFWMIVDIAVSPSGSIYVSDVGNKKIRKVTPRGYVTTLVDYTKIQFNLTCMTIDSNGNLFIFDTDENNIIKITLNREYYLGIESGNLVLVPSSLTTINQNPENFMHLRLEWKQGISPTGGVYLPSDSAPRTDYRRLVKSRTHTANTITVYTGPSTDLIIQLQSSAIQLYNSSSTIDSSRNIMNFYPTSTLDMEYIEVGQQTSTPSGLRNQYDAMDYTSTSIPDRSGLNNTLTLTGNPPKNSKGYVEFNASGRSGRATANLPNALQFTVIFTVNMVSTTPIGNTGFSMLFATAGPFQTGTSGASIKIGHTNVDLKVSIFGNNSDSTFGGSVLDPLGVPIVLAITYNTGYLILYKNGTQIGTSTNSVTTGVNLSNFIIGNWDQQSNPFNGSIREFALYDREMSSAEITSVSASFRSRTLSLYRQLNNYDITGYDISQGSGGTNLEDCLYYCDLDSTCKGVVLIPSTNRCYLKNSITGLYTQPDRNFYIKPGETETYSTPVTEPFTELLTFQSGGAQVEKIKIVRNTNDLIVTTGLSQKASVFKRQAASASSPYLSTPFQNITFTGLIIPSFLDTDPSGDTLIVSPSNMFIRITTGAAANVGKYGSSQTIPNPEPNNSAVGVAFNSSGNFLSLNTQNAYYYTKDTVSVSYILRNSFNLNNVLPDGRATSFTSVAFDELNNFAVSGGNVIFYYTSSNLTILTPGSQTRQVIYSPNGYAQGATTVKFEPTTQNIAYINFFYSEVDYYTKGADGRYGSVQRLYTDPSGRPIDLAFDSNGNIAVANLYANTVSFFKKKSDGTYEASKNIQLDSVPSSVAFDSNGNLVIGFTTGDVQFWQKN